MPSLQGLENYRRDSNGPLTARQEPRVDSNDIDFLTAISTSPCIAVSVPLKFRRARIGHRGM